MQSITTLITEFRFILLPFLIKGHSGMPLCISYSFLDYRITLSGRHDKKEPLSQNGPSVNCAPIVRHDLTNWIGDGSLKLYYHL